MTVEDARTISPVSDQGSDLLSSARNTVGPGRPGGPQLRTLGLVIATVVAFAVAAIIADLWIRATWSPHAWTRHLDASIDRGLAWHGWGTLLIFLLVLAHFGHQGYYTQRIPSWIAFRGVILACLLALCGDLVLTTLVYRAPFGREAALRWILFVPVLLSCRTVARVLLTRLGLWHVNTLIIGEGEPAARVRAALASEPALGYRIVGQASPGMLATLHSPLAWQRFAESRGAEMLVNAGRLGGTAPGAHPIAVIGRAPSSFAFISSSEALPVIRHRPHYFIGHDITFLTYQNDWTSPIRRGLKLGFDVTAAAVLIVLAAPALLAIAFLIRLDGGPVLFRHKRIGAKARPFNCLKFRTMRTDADRLLASLLARDPTAAAEWKERRKLHHDPRVTAIGQFLRKTSLDELPQLFNVLRGEMSLVGPRPIVAAEIEQYGIDIAYYYGTRPGVTGLWQASGRSDTSYRSRVKFDVWYVKNWSLWHDLVILLRTVPAVLLKRGAI